MKQTIANISNDQVVFKETFQSEYNTRVRLGGVPTDVSYSGGKAIGNGTTSIITYTSRPEFGNTFTPIKTWKFKLTCTANNGIIASHGASTNDYIFGVGETAWFGGSSQENKLNVWATTTKVSSTMDVTDGIERLFHIVMDGTNTLLYVNGVLNDSITSVPVFIRDDRDLKLLGDGTRFLEGSLDGFEIYEGVWSASQVANDYNKSTYKALTDTDDITTLSNLTMRNGLVQDRYNTITNTGDVKVVPSGGITSAQFTGANNLAYASDIIGTANALVFIPFKLRNVTADHKIFGNNKFHINYQASNKRIRISRDATTYHVSADNSIVNTDQYYLGIYSTSSGTSIYIGTIKTPMTISGSALQAAGALTAGTALLVGRNSGGFMTGNMSDCWIETHGSIDAVIALKRLEQLHTLLRPLMS